MPRMLLRQGINDVVRISDARMSGTSFGTVVLHVAPESAIGGPLNLVHTGDESNSTSRPQLKLNISATDGDRRAKLFRPARPHYLRGYGRLFLEHVTQANKGCDFDFLAMDYATKWHEPDQSGS